MGKPVRKYVAKAEPGGLWRIWNKKSRQWWGEYYKRRPDELIDELNNAKRPDVIINLTKQLQIERNERIETKWS